jgi:hypothetical protein
VSTATTEYSHNGRDVFCVIHTEMLYTGHVRGQSVTLFVFLKGLGAKKKLIGGKPPIVN